MVLGVAESTLCKANSRAPEKIILAFELCPDKQQEVLTSPHCNNKIVDSCTLISLAPCFLERLRDTYDK